jgi:hypothetical protein
MRSHDAPSDDAVLHDADKRCATCDSDSCAAHDVAWSGSRHAHDAGRSHAMRIDKNVSGCNGVREMRDDTQNGISAIFLYEFLSDGLYGLENHDAVVPKPETS